MFFFKAKLYLSPRVDKCGNALRCRSDLGVTWKQDRLAVSGMQGDQKTRQALQPYLVSGPRRGVIGTSRAAQRLRKQILEASKTRWAQRAAH